MQVAVSVNINKPVADVWSTIINFKNCTNYIESIIDLQILKEPKDTLVGFKWKETRVMFGKEATETMWIRDYVENEFYQTRAESNGSVYISKLSVEQDGESTKLTMSFQGEAQTVMMKILSVCMGFMMTGMMKKAMLKDLNDIKNYLELKQQ